MFIWYMSSRFEFNNHLRFAWYLLVAWYFISLNEKHSSYIFIFSMPLAQQYISSPEYCTENVLAEVHSGKYWYAELRRKKSILLEHQHGRTTEFFLRREQQQRYDVATAQRQPHRRSSYLTLTELMSSFFEQSVEVGRRKYHERAASIVISGRLSR